MDAPAEFDYIGLLGPNGFFGHVTPGREVVEGFSGQGILESPVRNAGPCEQVCDAGGNEVYGTGISVKEQGRFRSGQRDVKDV
jgi:hypothetical protein